MKINHHFSAQLFQSRAPFSHLVSYGGIAYISGIIGQRRDTGELAATTVAGQAAAAFDNLAVLLAEVGLRKEDVIRTTLYILDYAMFDELNTIYAQNFTAPYPARTTLQVAALPLGAKVQVDAVVADSRR